MSSCQVDLRGIRGALDYLMKDVDGYVPNDAHRLRAIDTVIPDYAEDLETFRAEHQKLEEARRGLATLEAERDRLLSRLRGLQDGADEARAEAADLRAQLHRAATRTDGRLARHAEAADRARKAAEQRAAEADSRAQQAGHRAAAAERRLRDAEQRARGAQQAADATRDDAQRVLGALDGALAAMAKGRRRNWILAHSLDRILAVVEGYAEPSRNHDRIRERTENALRAKGVDLPPADRPPKFPIPSRDSFLEAARTRLTED